MQTPYPGYDHLYGAMLHTLYWKRIFKNLDKVFTYPLPRQSKSPLLAVIVVPDVKYQHEMRELQREYLGNYNGLLITY